MTGSSNRFFMSLPANLLKYIDETVEVINLAKKPYASKTNRQAVIRGIMEYCQRKNVQFSSTWSRHVWVKDEEISE